MGKSKFNNEPKNESPQQVLSYFNIKKQIDFWEGIKNSKSRVSFQGFYLIENVKFHFINLAILLFWTWIGSLLIIMESK